MKTAEIQQLFEYHHWMTQKVWESIMQLTDEQFVQDEAYSRGSIRNLMVHLASTDRRWLAGLKNLPDTGHLDPKDYPSREAARASFERVASDLTAYVSTLTDADLETCAAGMNEPRWQILLHLVNHGTDHRATVLQQLQEFGAPTFPQDFVIWLWGRK